MSDALIDGGAHAVPPEWWEIKRDAFMRRAADSAWFARMLRVRGMVTWGGLIGVFVVAIVLPEILVGLRITLWSMIALVVMFLLARTKTIRFSSTSAMFTAGATWAFLIVAISYLGAGVADLDIVADGASIAIASWFEEALKLTPLLVVAVLAPGRVRRFSLADWLLLGFAAGMGFNAAEDGAREFLYAVEPLTPLQELFGGGRASRRYGFNPLVAGKYDTGSAVSPGHQVYTATAALGLGIGLMLWRKWSVPARTMIVGRAAAVAVGVFVFLVPVSGHAGFNASIRASNFADVEGVGYPSVMGFIWNQSDAGRRQIPWFVALLIGCTIADGVRRARLRAREGTFQSSPDLHVWPLDVEMRHDEFAAGQRSAERFGGARDSERGWMRSLAPRIESVAGILGSIVAGIRNDITVFSYARTSPEEPRADAIRRGRDATEQHRALREQVMTSTIAGVEPHARNGFRRTWIGIGAAGTIVSLVLGIFVAQAIGPDLASRADGFGPLADDLNYFANLFHALGDWWNSQGFLTQMALMIGIAALIAFTGGSFWWAFWAAGLADFALRKHEGIATFAQDPRAATTNYLQTTTPQQSLFDVVEVALTSMLPSAGGAAAGATAREVAEQTARETGEQAARESAEQASREAAEQAAKEAADQTRRNLAEEIQAIRSRLGLGDTHTIGAGTTDIPGLEGEVFEGLSPALRRESGLPPLDDVYGADRAIQAPRSNPLFTRHAEEDLFNSLHQRLQSLADPSAMTSGRTVTIEISNPSGICTACVQGLRNPSVAPGVIKQFSELYPELTVRIVATGGQARPGVSELVVLGGKIIE